MSEAPAVELRQASKIYADGTKAVDNVSFVVPQGQFIALLGPSGCGKTTTLRLINRLEEATSGQVLVRGQDVARQRPEQLRRSIGYVIQEGGLFPHQSVSVNVATVPRLLHWPVERVRTRSREVLDLVGLPEEQYGERLPSELSGGQRQRVGVARGLAADPDVLLMDEPFGALDPGTRASIQDEFLRLQATLKKTVVMVTHDVSEAGKMADRIVLMHEGAIVQEGPLRDLLLSPANDHVRAFLGKQGHGLALESLQLSAALDHVPTTANAETELSLASSTTLGQSLIALGNVADNTKILIEDLQTCVEAGRLRDAILADLRQAEQAFRSSEVR